MTENLADTFKMTENEIQERKKYLALQLFYDQVKKAMEELEWKLKK